MGNQPLEPSSSACAPKARSPAAAPTASTRRHAGENCGATPSRQSRSVETPSVSTPSEARWSRPPRWIILFRAGSGRSLSFRLRTCKRCASVVMVGRLRRSRGGFAMGRGVVSVLDRGLILISSATCTSASGGSGRWLRTYATSLNSLLYFAVPDTPVMACASKIKTTKAASGTPSHWLARP